MQSQTFRPPGSVLPRLVEAIQNSRCICFSCWRCYRALGSESLPHSRKGVRFPQVPPCGYACSSGTFWRNHSPFGLANLGLPVPSCLPVAALSGPTLEQFDQLGPFCIGSPAPKDSPGPNCPRTLCLTSLQPCATQS